MKAALILLLVVITVLLLVTRITSSYTAGTPANDLSVLSLPVTDSSGNYQDIDPATSPWSTAANYVLDSGTPSWSQANINCWASPNCTGIRHNFDTHQTWYLNQPIDTTKTSAASALTPVVTYNGARYRLPLAIVAARSTQDPNAPVDCTWTSTTGACSTTVCDTPGTQTTTWSVGTPASHGGVCSPAPASTTAACNTNNACPWIPISFITAAPIAPAPAGVPQTRIVTFSTIGTTSWTVPAGVTSVQVLVVGGGGGGGWGWYYSIYDWVGRISGGGGGGGGVIYNGSYSVTPGNSVTVTVGGGGTGGNINGDRPPSNGGNSVFGALTAYGGGAGSTYGSSGGSGGGGSSNYTNGNYSYYNGGAGTAGQGYNGASAGGGAIEVGGGGGGAGSAASGYTGGSGYTSTISGSSYTYSSGGGATTGTTGGTPTTYGSGGFGGGYSGNSYPGSAGFQGIVIIKYIN